MEKTMASMFDEWYEPRENELMDMEPEDIARQAFMAGMKSRPTPRALDALPCGHAVTMLDPYDNSCLACAIQAKRQ